MAVDIWSFRMEVDDVDLSDFVVEASDGEIGKVDRATDEAGGDALIVDTGPLVFGRKVMLPFGTVERIDPENRRIYVDRTKDEIKHAPEYDDTLASDMSYRDRIQAYYGPEGAGYRSADTRDHLLSGR
jgi:hypothetical protein